ADLSRASPTALRLVPEALLRAHRLMPVAEGPQTLDVAAADPTSLDAELELIRVTGRTPVLFVAPPGAIEAALERTLGARPRAPRRPGPRAVVPGAHRVLVVDDDAGSRLLASAVLTKRGYEVVQAEDGVEALHRLRQSGPFSLVVADLNMPHMDGLSLLWELRSGEQWAHLPVLVLTGETDEALEAQLIDEGADDYICKPLDPRLFLARVRATIRRAEEGVGVPVPGPTDARDGEPHGPEAR
ncbi:MAG TPA: response regulator, partial [Longimicrobiales bacterium]|nr:response regulator [Longimicrobiales bacterium]